MGGHRAQICGVRKLACTHDRGCGSSHEEGGWSQDEAERVWYVDGVLVHLNRIWNGTMSREAEARRLSITGPPGCLLSGERGRGSVAPWDRKEKIASCRTQECGRSEGRVGESVTEVHIRSMGPEFVTDSDETPPMSTQSDDERTGLRVLVASALCNSSSCTSCADDSDVWVSGCGCSMTDSRVAAAGPRLSSAAAESWASPREVGSRSFYRGHSSCQHASEKTLRTYRRTFLDSSRSRLSFRIHSLHLSKSGFLESNSA